MMSNENVIKAKRQFLSMLQNGDVEGAKTIKAKLSNDDFVFVTYTIKGEADAIFQNIKHQIEFAEDTSITHNGDMISVANIDVPLPEFRNYMLSTYPVQGMKIQDEILLKITGLGCNK